MGSFADDLKRFDAKTRDKMDLAVRKLSLDLFSSVILKSPVDTGRFRGNWQVKIGSVPAGTIELDDKTGSATVAKAQAISAGVKAGDVIYLANNLPYAMRLENGYSSQAPNGMVALTVQEFQGIVKAINDELGRI